MLERADKVLVTQGLFETRAQARLAILSGRVSCSGHPITKPSQGVDPLVMLTLSEGPRFVSRGGEKLQALLEAFPQIPVEGVHGLDIGASTGGFSDCLLQHGAASMTCVDVGHTQLHPSLLRDPRITNLEGINARTLSAQQLPRPHYPLIVVDLSFISLKQVLPALWPILVPGGHLIALVKPQFEADKNQMRACKGVIKDDLVRTKALTSVLEFCTQVCAPAATLGPIDSPFPGGDGNKEYLVAWVKK